MKSPHIEVTIIRTHEDGRREAAVLQSIATADGWLAPVGLIYRYLRTTRRKDAPPHFRFGVLSDEQRALAERLFEE